MPKRVPKPFGIIVPVGKHPQCLGQLVEKGRCASEIADLAGRDEEAQGATVSISYGVQLGINAVLGPSDQAPEIPFSPQGWKPGGSLEIGRINHDGPGMGSLGGEAFYHLAEHTHSTPSFPAVPQCFVRFVVSRRIPQAPAIPIDEGNPAQDPSVIDTRIAVALRKTRR